MTGTEPVSAENLSAALQAANLDREVLFAGCIDVDSSGGSIETSVSFDEYAAFIIEWSDSGAAYSQQVPCTVNVEQALSNRVDFEPFVNGSRRFFSFDSSGTCIVTRIIGIRSGGGQLLADALSRLLREVG